MTFTTHELVAIFRRCTAKIHEVAPQLNELDGQLGDGDLGATLEKCARLIEQALETQPKDIGALFQLTSMACVRASGSSFGTLLGVALLTAAQKCSDKTMLQDTEISPLLQDILSALMARGGASLGDKTVLDAINALQQALANEPNSDRWREVAPQAIDQALNDFRQKPNKIGRARMFSERSKGMNDPGMVAFSHLVAAAVSPLISSEETS
ncbi:dihydroxyacetone kinase subunit L [Pantoea sp. BAV 3049]|uniref:dihydroxyacetone kinase subunit L n=1 Tax=Pantoea sp. BAV 3049 TaxID=2654188 RepID=UPI00131CC629|nr:dihydroxyacetone kinase subunit L [Pantoea sp. BAV 3049]